MYLSRYLLKMKNLNWRPKVQGLNDGFIITEINKFRDSWIPIKKIPALWRTIDSITIKMIRLIVKNCNAE